MISNTPMPHPINAPTIGISDKAPISTLIRDAYGRPIKSMDTPNISPRIIASTHCPDIKLENVLLESSATSRISFANFSSKNA